MSTLCQRLAVTIVLSCFMLATASSSLELSGTSNSDALMWLSNVFSGSQPNLEYKDTGRRRSFRGTSFRVILLSGGGKGGRSPGMVSRPSLRSTSRPAGTQLILRGCFLLLLFLFPAMTSGLAYLFSWFRNKIWYDALTRSIALSGTAFIKWGQWSSTRPDMFPEELCKSLSVLHKGAPRHRFRHTRKLVERAYNGRKLEDVFDWFEEKPLASGSIAQVHKAVLHGEIVAVKVRHPNVKQRIFMDFQIMKKIAQYTDATPSLKWMNLGPSMEQFSHTMAAQTDLLLEACNLDQFNRNFRGWSDCKFPVVLRRAEDVLVETFQDGCVVSEYAKLFGRKLNGNPGLWEWAQLKMTGRSSQQTTDATSTVDPLLGHFVVTRGEDMWLKMVLNDGLLHADLHPGNILIHAPQGEPPSLVLVDAGMVAKLYGNQRRNFIRLLECLGAGDGVGAAQAVLKFSAKQSCVGKEEQEAFCRDMDTVFRERCRGYHTDVDVGDVLRGVLTCVRRHSVTVDVEYATLILNILCLDSMGKALLPSYNILDGAQPLLEMHKVGSRVLGHAGIKFMLPLARAVKGRQDRRFLERLISDGRTQAKQQQEEQQQQQIEERAVVAQHEDPRNDLESSAIVSGSAAAIGSPSGEPPRIEAPSSVSDTDDTVEAESEPTSPQVDASVGRRAEGGDDWFAGGVGKDDDDDDELPSADDDDELPRADDDDELPCADDDDELPCADLRDLDSEAGIVEAAGGVVKEALHECDAGVDSAAEGVGLRHGAGSA